MGKKKDESVNDDEVMDVEGADEEPIDDDTPVVSKIAKGTIPLTDKFFEQHMPDVHKYTRAYLVVQFKGEMKTESAWKSAIKEAIKS